MVLEIFLVVFAAAASAWVTWTFNTRIYDRKLANYTKVISDFDSQNRELVRQSNILRQTVEANANNPHTKELERKSRENNEKWRTTVETINKIRSKIENDYANHSLGQYVLGELDRISPSEKSLEAQREKSAQDVFQRIRGKMDGSDTPIPAGAKIGDLAKGR